MPNLRKLTPQVHKKIVAALKRGAHRKHAAHAAGINITTFTSWLEQGRTRKDGTPGEEPYATFAKEVRMALAQHAVNTMEAITRAERRDWRAAAWKLERMFPKVYGSKRTHEIEAGSGVKEALLPLLQKHYGMEGMIGSDTSDAADDESSSDVPAPAPEPEE